MQRHVFSYIKVPEATGGRESRDERERTSTADTLDSIALVHQPKQSIPESQSRAHPLLFRSTSVYRRATEFNHARGKGTNPSVILPKAVSSYVPNSSVPRTIPERFDAIAENDPRSRKIIVSRYLLEDGEISFSLGTRFGGTIQQDHKEVNLKEILNHVTPEELDRFETEQFLREDEEEEERERLLALKKPRGRPGKNSSTLEKPSSLTSSTDLERLSKSDDENRKRRGRPRKHLVPSFHGPRPSQQVSVRVPPSVINTRQASSDVEDDKKTRSSNMKVLIKPRIYSIVSAAGIKPETPEPNVDTISVISDATSSPTAQEAQDAAESPNLEQEVHDVWKYSDSDQEILNNYGQARTTPITKLRSPAVSLPRSPSLKRSRSVSNQEEYGDLDLRNERTKTAVTKFTSNTDERNFLTKQRTKGPMTGWEEVFGRRPGWTSEEEDDDDSTSADSTPAKIKIVEHLDHSESSLSRGLPCRELTGEANLVRMEPVRSLQPPPSDSGSSSSEEIGPSDTIAVEPNDTGKHRTLILPLSHGFDPLEAAKGHHSE